jgi:hypothetical protein
MSRRRTDRHTAKGAEQHEELLQHYPASDRALLAELEEARPSLTGMEAAKARRLFVNFLNAEPKRGWQRTAREIIDRHAARKVEAEP